MSVNLSPVGGAAAQFFDNNGNPLSGGKIYTYEAGTTTPRVAYTTSAGNVPHTNPIILDSAGRVPGGQIWLTDGNIGYKFLLETSTSVLVGTFDNIPPGTSDTAADIVYLPAGVGAVATTVQKKLRESISLADFLPVGYVAGTTDATAAIASAISALKAQGGGELRLGRGSILLNGTAGADGIVTGILVPYVSPNGLDARVRIVGEGRATILLAGTNNMLMLRFSDSHGGVENCSFSGNGKTGVYGLGAVPENTTQTTSVVYQLYNLFRNIYIKDLQEGIWIKPGPNVAGVDSGSWYNRYEDIDIFGCVRAIWFANSTTAGSMNTRSKFVNIRCGQTSMNTGVQIDNGSSMVFIGCDFEGIAAGVFPNAIPTSVKIANAASFGASNDDNQFYACFNEANTRDLDNANASLTIVGGFWQAVKFGGGGVNPLTMLGGEPSLMPLLLPGVKYGEGVAGYPSGYWGVTKNFADTGFVWNNYALNTGNITNTTSVTGVVSKFMRFNDFVEWQFTLLFRATVAGTELLITPPITPATLFYTTAVRNSFFSFWVGDGSATPKHVSGGFTNTGQFYIAAPNAWDTQSGNNNSLFVSIRYHI